MYMYVRMCIYICMYVHTHITDTHVYIYIYIHTHTWYSPPQKKSTPQVPWVSCCIFFLHDGVYTASVHSMGSQRNDLPGLVLDLERNVQKPDERNPN